MKICEANSQSALRSHLDHATSAHHHTIDPYGKIGVVAMANINGRQQDAKRIRDSIPIKAQVPPPSTTKPTMAPTGVRMRGKRPQHVQKGKENQRTGLKPVMDLESQLDGVIGSEHFQLVLQGFLVVGARKFCAYHEQNKVRTNQENNRHIKKTPGPTFAPPQNLS
jgi:hypothetical protein